MNFDQRNDVKKRSHGSHVQGRLQGKFCTAGKFQCRRVFIYLPDVFSFRLFSQVSAGRLSTICCTTFTLII